VEAALAQPVLVLNRLWQAVNVVSTRRAFCLLSRGEAHVVEFEDSSHRIFSLMDWIDFSASNPPASDVEAICTVRHRLRLPRVILLTVFDQLPVKELKLTRNNVFERDSDRCQYCGNIFERRDLNLDHVIPRHYGGKTTWENIVCSCVRCNTRKANRLPHEAGMRLVRKPVRPKWRPVISTLLGHGRTHPSWKTFLDLAYWNVELED
jgi:5-methylcytosine-specific restriction endonuclease McrA